MEESRKVVFMYKEAGAKQDYSHQEMLVWVCVRSEIVPLVVRIRIDTFAREQTAFAERLWEDRGH